MPRSSQPTAPQNKLTEAARELMAIHAERRIGVKLNDVHLTSLFYNNGIPVDEIATAYQVTPAAVYAILAKQEASR